MDKKIPKTTELYGSDSSVAASFLFTFEYPWEALTSIAEAIASIGCRLDKNDYYSFDENIWIAKSATVAESAVITGPCIIDAGAEIRHCAFIRGNVIVGKGAVVGNSTELKNCILFDGVQVPHYNYIGDSILGYKSHMGAGAITSNVKCDRSLVVIKSGEQEIATRLKKCGAFLGDFAEVGCGAVLNPGTVIGKRTSVYPLSSVRGALGEDCIYKKCGQVVKRSKKV